MIADPNSSCSPNSLQQLLDDQLSAEQTAATEAHLESCSHCRDALHELAGDDPWWIETQSVLRSTTLATPAKPQRPLAPSHVSDSSAKWSSDQWSSVQWIQPLLQANDTTGMLGTLGSYPVVEVLGQGGMGVVLRGLDRELNRPVAIKVLAPHLAGVGAARQRFMREAQAAAAIVHPNVIPIYGIETDAALPYLVMPFVAGGNLQQRIDEHGAMELEDVLRIGVQVAEGLAAAHRHGVIHRDVKPANILVEASNGRVLISDFGLARALDDATLTVSGMIAGTPQYMSPEQALGETVDARSDLFSLGSLLFALATGRPPFRAESPLAVLRKISDHPPRPVHQINERMPPWFSRLVQALMQIDVSRRIASADAAAELISETLQHVRQPGQTRLPSRLSRKRVSKLQSKWAWGIAVPLLLAIVFVFWQPGRNQVRTTPTAAPPVIQPTTAAVVKTAPEFDSSWEATRWYQAMRELQAKIDEIERAQ